MAEKKISKGLVFTGILLITGVLSFVVIRPYINVLFAAWLYAVLVWPWYQMLRAKNPTWPQWLITLATLLTSFFLVILPVVVFTGLALGQLSSGWRQISFDWYADQFSDWALEINETLDQVPFLEVELSPERISAYIEQWTEWLAMNMVNLLRGVSTFSVSIITDLVLVVVVLFALLPNLDKTALYIRKLSPLSDKATKLFMTRTKILVMDTFKATIMIAIVQSVTTGLFLWLLQLPNVLLWSFLVFITSFVPVIGTAIVTLPIALVMSLVYGNWVQAALVLGWQILVMANVDNVVRPRMTSVEARVPGVIMLVAVLGGISRFGLWGVFYGPLIVGLFLAALEVYLEEFKKY